RLGSASAKLGVNRRWLLGALTFFSMGCSWMPNCSVAKGASPQNIRRAGVPGFGLRIGERATLLRDPDACAYGLLMELTHEEIEQLYSESSVCGYRPEAILAELDDGSRLPALCFNLVEPPHPDEHNSEYAA